jgi:predicted O-methyltransferase YrrM
MRTKDEILEFVLNAGSDSTEVFGGKFKGGYELQQCPEEITDFLMTYQGTEVNNFLEIGVAAGGNTRIFTDFLNIKDVYTMDLNEHPSINYEGNPNARDNNFKNLKNSGTLISFFGDSHSENARKWLENLNIKFDMVFIDGDHTENGIKLDTELVLPFLVDNAFVIYHDTVINVGSEQFDKKLKSGLFNVLKHEKDFISNTIYKKGISVYRYVKG